MWGTTKPLGNLFQASWIVDDDLWTVIEPLPPAHERPVGTPGRKPLDDREAWRGILFVLYTGIPWQ